MQMTKNSIVQELFLLQDLKYRDFHSRLVPNLPKDTIIGVRTPDLRKFTKGLNRKDLDAFLCNLPHKYYEENNIHAFAIQQIKDFDECISQLEKFFPYIDNWATCDCLRPKCFKYNTEKLYPYIEKWINDDKIYVVRFAIGMLNSYYMGRDFDESHLKLVCSVKNSDYYVKMMIAWYFATVLTFHFDSALPYMERRVLEKWTHNKAIQKACESFRVPEVNKRLLRQMKAL